MFNHLVIDIAGRCNAHCKWCTTGRANVAGKPKGGFMEPDVLAEALDSMRKQKIISPEAIIFLYNWGEPFLHPKFEDIARVIAERGHQFVVSSNLSAYPKIKDKTILSHFRAIVASMPGFSQTSYDRQHGFSFEKIKQNITQMVSSYRANGFTGKVQIKYHVYQFNLNEAPALFEFAKELNICVQPTFATFADLGLYMDYLEGTLSRKEERKISKEMLLSGVAEKEMHLPEDYECPYYEALILNEKAEIVTCCMVTPEMEDFVIGSLANIPPDEISTRKRQQAVCERCIRLGVPELIAQRAYPLFLDEIDLSLALVPDNRPVVIWGAGVMAKRMAERLNSVGITDIQFIKDELTDAPTDLPENMIVGSSILADNENNNFFIVANEFVAPSVERLQELGYRNKKDYLVNTIAAHG
nr:radical SAM protein [uncultured Pseudodesulfovibrio sp.]